MKSILCSLALALTLTQGVWAVEYYVDGENAAASDDNPGNTELPFLTIGKGAEVAGPGDTVRVRPGLYREFVQLKHSGEPGAPITFMADPAGSVVITGADPVTGWQRVPGDAPIYRIDWEHRFIINTIDGKPIEHHPFDFGWGENPRWGRAEQFIADGRQLVPVRGFDTLEVAWAERPATVNPRTIPDPEDPATWTGVYAVDTEAKEVRLFLHDGADPNEHDMLGSTRGLVFGTNQWLHPEGGVHDVHVRGFTFRYGASWQQRGIVWLYGHDNLLENCIVEQAWGGGAIVNGTMRRCVLRYNGHVGGGADGNGLLNVDSLWEGNSWKPIHRIWDAGGQKITWVDGGLYRRCVFRDNGGPGLWMDIHVRNVLVTECVFMNNEESGLFIEISRDVTAVRNLFVGNGIGAMGKGQGEHIGWGAAGIMIGESMNCLIAQNTCIGNKDGITMREHGPRNLKTEDYGVVPYICKGNVIVDNVCAYNVGYQLGLWYDNGFFGRHPRDKEKFATEEAYAEHLKATPDKAIDPTAQGMTIDRNVYYVGEGQKLALYGVPWRARRLKLDDLGEFTAATGFDANSLTADPELVDRAKGNYRFAPDSTAMQQGAGWAMPPESINSWMDTFLPSWR